MDGKQYRIVLKVVLDVAKEEERKKQREEELRKEKEQRIQEIKKEEEKQIECPECRKNFSAKLSVCPYCGLSLEDKENVKRLNEIRVMENMLMDKRGYVKIILQCLGYATLSILLFALDATGWSFLIALACGGIACVYLLGIIIAVNDNNSLKNKIDLARTDYEKYKDVKRKSDAEAIANRNRIAEERARKDTINHPVCPMCGSKNTMKISTVNRAASVAMVGVASSKIGKQYQCKACGYKW